MAGRRLGGGGSLAREARAERPQCGRRLGGCSLAREARAAAWERDMDGVAGVATAPLMRAAAPMQAGRRRSVVVSAASSLMWAAPSNAGGTLNAAASPY